MRVYKYNINMTNEKMRFVRISLNSVLIVLVIIGVIMQSTVGLLGAPGFRSFLYYTTQSNLIMALLSAFLIYYDFKKREPTIAIKVMHHIAVTAVLLTFTVFALMLGGYIENTRYFYSIQNLTLHNLAPIIAVFVYLLYDYKLPRYTVPLALISGVTYMLFTYILYFSGVNYGTHGFPYFFLDFKTYGWLTINWPSFGILYWWVLIIIFMYTMSGCLVYLRNKTRKYKQIPLFTLSVLLCLALIFIVINIIIWL